MRKSGRKYMGIHMASEEGSKLSEKALKRIELDSYKIVETIKVLSKLNIKIYEKEINVKIGDLESINALSSSGDWKIKFLDEKDKYNLDAKEGIKYLEEHPLIAGYDESINKFTTLQGTAYLFSHTIIFMFNGEYIPQSLLALYFFTSIKDLVNLKSNTGIIVTENVSYMSKQVYVEDKVKFLENKVPPNTILFVDGPLIAGDWYPIVISAIKDYFTPRNIIPIFLVKNSRSKEIIESNPKLRSKYNSDMHWAYTILNKGQRTGYFIYRDVWNPQRNSKIFCYLKAFDSSPIRIEIHPITFRKYGRDVIDSILNLIYYLLLVNGDAKSPQIRIIAIAEKYARETIHLIDLESLIRSSGLMPTMNQERFGWST